MKIAFSGASGTGKTTVARRLAELMGLPFNPVGARTVAAEMGFDCVQDVDAAGRRVEFQLQLASAKNAWEAEAEAGGGFITDRAGWDDFTYAEMHCPELALDRLYRDFTIKIFDRYDLVFFCPISTFQHLGTDPNRNHDHAYQAEFEIRLWSRLQGHDLVVPLLRPIEARWDEVLGVLQRWS